jgi:hypothetical protein
MIRTRLAGADLSGADLTNARVTEEQLREAESLAGATMPNGQKYEDWLKDKGVARRMSQPKKNPARPWGRQDWSRKIPASVRGGLVAEEYRQLTDEQKMLRYFYEELEAAFEQALLAHSPVDRRKCSPRALLAFHE